MCSVCSEGLQAAVLINISLWSITSFPDKCKLIMCTTADKQLRSFKGRTSSIINMKGVWESSANPLMSRDWRGDTSWKSSPMAEERWTVWPPVWTARARNTLKQTAQLLRGSWTGKRSEFCHRRYFCGLLSKAMPNKFCLSQCAPHRLPLSFSRSVKGDFMLYSVIKLLNLATSGSFLSNFVSALYHT